MSMVKHQTDMEARKIKINGEDYSSLAGGLNGVLLIELMSSSYTKKKNYIHKRFKIVF